MSSSPIPEPADLGCEKRSNPNAASAKRADYASTRPRYIGAWISAVEPESPADDAGIEPGMRIDAVDGKPLRDIIDWRWEADGDEVELDVWLPEEEELCSATLYREPGQDWGIDFSDVLFDGIRTCVNACQFCFMAMLPEDARDSLMLRDDDYRLSFLQGNFVTLTNVTDDEVERIIRCRLEPMNVSLHAISPDVRRSLIGRNAQRGVDVLERLLEAGIEVHGQIVVCAGINDGEELRRTLDWVERHPTFTSLALVPMGYTRYSKRFSSSFSEDVAASRAVVKLVEPYQERARRQLGITRFQLSDEFYLDAELLIPPAETYDGYPQFYDGIGMLRSFLDEVDVMVAERGEELVAIRGALAQRAAKALIVCGEAAERVVDAFCHAWDGDSHADGCPIEPFAIRNDYYGGDVNVTGLIVSCDLLAQLPADLTNLIVILPEVMFNFDHVTLDGETQDHIVEELQSRGATVRIAQTSPNALLDAIAEACSD